MKPPENFVPNNSMYLTHSSTMQEENFVKEIKLMPESRANTVADADGLVDRKYTIINKISD
jgi:hypothetical protein